MTEHDCCAPKKRQEDKKNKGLICRSLLFGSLGSALLFGIYLGILTLANSFSHALEQFLLLWFWMAPLIVGFGLQVGLFTFMRGYARKRQAMHAVGSSAVGATGGIATGSMVACCMHHLADVLPLIGISAIALFLGKFQTVFLFIGVASSLMGLTLMLKHIQEHRLYDEDHKILSRILSFSMTKTMYGLSTVSAVLFIVILINTI